MRAMTALAPVPRGTYSRPGAVGDWDFRVLLDGREIGRHRYTLESEGQSQALRSEARFDVRLLFFSASAMTTRRLSAGIAVVCSRSIRALKRTESRSHDAATPATADLWSSVPGTRPA